MHYEGNKEAKGYTKSMSETEQLVRANLSKDEKTDFRSRTIIKYA